MVLLEVEAGDCSALLRLAGDDAGCIGSLRQVPLVGRALVLRIFRSTFHVQGVLTDELYVTSLVRLLLILVAR